MKYGLNKTADIIFLIIIVLLLIIPLFLFGNRNVEKMEKRHAQEMPSIKKKHFAKIFYRYVSDRFILRYPLIAFNRNIHFLLTKNYYVVNNNVYDKTKNVVYSLPTFFGLDKLKEGEEEVISKNIQRLNEYCKSKNIKLYILIIPRRSDFVKYNTFETKKKTDSDKAVSIINYIKNNTDAEIIYPYNELKEENKRYPVFFKTDHHWTNSGAYVGYAALMKSIKKSFPMINILKTDDFEKTYNKKVLHAWDSVFGYGSIINNTGISESLTKNALDTEYLYFFHPDKKLFNRKNTSEYNLPEFNKITDRYFYYPKGYNAKILLIGDSFLGNLLEFVPYTFKETLSLEDHYRYFYFSKYESAVEQYKPDIIVLVFRTYYIKMLINLYKQKGS